VAKVTIAPRCARGENIFVSAEGYLLPCCYAHILLKASLTGDRRISEADGWFRRNLDLFDLKRRDAAAVLSDARWGELTAMWANDAAPSICYRYCGVISDQKGADPDSLRRHDRQSIPLAAAEPAPPAGEGAAPGSI
jgi:hypothetical protein